MQGTPAQGTLARTWHAMPGHQQQQQWAVQSPGLDAGGQRQAYPTPGALMLIFFVKHNPRDSCTV